MISIIEYLNKNSHFSIPLNDVDAWLEYDNYNFLYDKLKLSEIQNINCAPIPCYPDKYPIIIKPIINLYGMSKGFKYIKSEDEFTNYIKNNNLCGFFWQDYFEGNQYNIDLIFKNGKLVKYYTLYSEPNKFGTFKYHKYIDNYTLDSNLIYLLEELLEDYTGFVNIEVINNKIIECHLRLNGDCFIYNEKHFNNFFNLFNNKKYYLDIPNEYNNMFPIFTKNLNYDLIKLEKYLSNLTTIKKYVIDNITSDNQGNKLKRCAYFITDDFNKGLDIQKNIYLENI